MTTLFRNISARFAEIRLWSVSLIHGNRKHQAAQCKAVKNTEENDTCVLCKYGGGREKTRLPLAENRTPDTAGSQDEKEELKMSIDWEELLGAEGEDLDDAYDEAVSDAEWWLERYDD